MSIAVDQTGLHQEPELMPIAPSLALFVPQVIADYATDSFDAQPLLLQSDAQLFQTLALLHQTLSDTLQNYLTESQALHSDYLRLNAALLQAVLEPLPLSADIAQQPVTTSSMDAVGLSPGAFESDICTIPAVADTEPESLTADIALAPPLFDRKQLEILASGRIADVFGEHFACLDDYFKHLRLPMPPLLFCDRVIALTGEAGIVSRASITTEFEVQKDAWYLHQGRMPPGILIEACQGSLALLTWLGVDFENRGERVFRLLGMELSFSSPLPQVGDILRYDSHFEKEVRHDGTRLIFSNFECRIGDRLAIKIHKGQSGFFSEGELAKSEGILWDVATTEPKPLAESRLDAPAAITDKRVFSSADVNAFIEGRLSDCFGLPFVLGDTHVRTPTIPSGAMRFIQSVPVFDPAGGPWRRGYLRAECQVHSDDWFFFAHFKNDPCMPGSLMAEACLEAMAFYLAAMGYTLRHDGWRFEPIPEETFKFICRGQVTPVSKHLSYEVFVEEVIATPLPSLYASVLVHIDTLKAFCWQRVGLRLVPGWSLDEQSELVNNPVQTDNGIFDYQTLLLAAHGQVSKLFDAADLSFDGRQQRMLCLPTPPLLMVTRVCSLSSPVQEGSVLLAEYEVPEDAWYFRANAYPIMPFMVLLETVLQSAGLMLFENLLAAEETVFARNVKGSTTILTEVSPNAGLLTLRARINTISRIDATLLFNVSIDCQQQDVLVGHTETIFGLFPAEAWANQVALSVRDEEYAVFTAEDNSDVEPSSFTGLPALAAAPLLMLERISRYQPEGGRAGLGALRAEKTVDSREWFFKAYCFQDPMQPSSLGIEAMLQLLQCYMRLTDLAQGFILPRFEPVALHRPINWHYRGQVLPQHHKITTLLEVLERGHDEHGNYAVATGSIWVDGQKIYELSEFAMRIVETDVLWNRPKQLDPQRDLWLLDHCPTFTIPALAMMNVVEELATAVTISGKVLVELSDVSLNGWVSFANGSKWLRTQVNKTQVHDCFQVFLEESRQEASSYQRIASATLHFATNYPKAPPVMIFPEPEEVLHDRDSGLDIYAQGIMFHGSCYQVLRHLRRSVNGAIGVLDADFYGVPQGLLNPALLDGMTHGLPGQAPELWNSRIKPGQCGFPSRIRRMSLYAAMPIQGLAECRMRIVEEGLSTCTFWLQMIVNTQVVLDMEVIYVLFSKGSFAKTTAQKYARFIREHLFVEGVGLSRMDEHATRLTPAEIKASNWLPGTVAAIYATEDTNPAVFAIKDHVGQRYGVHPSLVEPAADFSSAVVNNQPLRRIPVKLGHHNVEVIVEDGGSAYLDYAAIRDNWRQLLNIAVSPVDAIYTALLECFLNTLELSEARMFNALAGKPMIFLLNQQSGVEAWVMALVSGYLTGSRPLLIAKPEFRKTWTGALLHHCCAYPGSVYGNLLNCIGAADKQALESVIALLPSGHRHLIVPADYALDSQFLEVLVNAGLPIISTRCTGKPEATFDLNYQLATPLMPEKFAKLGIDDPVATLSKLMNNATTPILPGIEPGFIVAALKRLHEQGRLCPVTVNLLQAKMLTHPEPRYEAWLRGLSELLDKAANAAEKPLSGVQALLANS